MNKQTFLQIQTLELKQLLDSAGDDPILAPQLRERLADAQRELEESRREDGTLLPNEPIVLPRTAFFLRGPSVLDSGGIRPSLAGEAMIQYERMFIQQSLHDEREAMRQVGRHRRRRGSPMPALLFTGTPRGSFGLEFVPQKSEEGTVEALAESLRNVAHALVLVGESDAQGLDEAIKQIPPGVLSPLKKFMKTLADHNAELRLAFPDRPSRSLSVELVRTAAERLETDVHQTQETVTGIFRGLTLETLRFDLRMESGEVISGTIADELSDEDMERLLRLINNRCVAKLVKTTVRKITGPATTTYVLTDAQSEPDSASPSPGRAIGH